MIASRGGLILRTALQCLLLSGIVLGTILPCAAQWPRSKAEQIGTMIDILTAVRDTVARHYHGQEAIAYKRTSVRMLQCAILFDLLEKSDDPTVEAARTDASAVLSAASGALYPGPRDEFNTDVDKATAGILQLYKSQDRQKLFYLTRNCHDISLPSTVATAIAELMLPTH
jgi:hypothetical protein